VEFGRRADREVASDHDYYYGASGMANHDEVVIFGMVDLRCSGSTERPNPRGIVNLRDGL